MVFVSSSSPVLPNVMGDLSWNVPQSYVINYFEESIGIIPI